MQAAKRWNERRLGFARRVSRVSGARAVDRDEVRGAAMDSNQVRRVVTPERSRGRGNVRSVDSISRRVRGNVELGLYSPCLHLTPVTETFIEQFSQSHAEPCVV